MRRYSLFFLAVIALLIGLWLLKPSLSPKKHLAHPQVTAILQADSINFPKKTIPTKGKAIKPAGTILSIQETAAPPSDPALLPPKLPGAIPNEYVAQFSNNDDYLKFVRLANAKGIRIKGLLPQWNAVRLQVSSEGELNSLLKEAPKPSDLSNNVAVSLPDFSNRKVEQPGGNYTPFGDQALSWLGVQGAHKNWGRGVKVAILDTALAESPALNESHIARLNMLQDAPSNDSKLAHGTAVASIISGTSPDASGIAPSADILGIRVLSNEGTGDAFTLAQGIMEAVQRGARVINLSLGSYGDSSILHQAVDYALQNHVAVVAAAGNDGINTVAYPARYDGVIAVGSVDSSRQHMSFSNSGPEISIVAPGLGVQAAWSDNQIVSFSGTSASAPFVSGALASLLSENPWMSAEEAKQILLRSSDDLGAPGHDPDYGNGVLNIQRLQQWNQKGIYDVAIADYYLTPTRPQESKIPVVVSFQNRGTEPLWSVQLDTTLNGVHETTYFNNLDVGQTMSKELLIDAAQLENAGALQISSDVTINGFSDSNLKNNRKVSSIRVAPASGTSSTPH